MLELRFIPSNSVAKVAIICIKNLKADKVPFISGFRMFMSSIDIKFKICFSTIPFECKLNKILYATLVVRKHLCGSYDLRTLPRLVPQISQLAHKCSLHKPCSVNNYFSNFNDEAPKESIRN